MSVLKAVNRDTLVREGLQQLDHWRMSGPIQMICPVVAQPRFELSKQSDDVGRIDIVIEGSSIPRFPALTPSVIWIGLKLRFKKIRSRLRSEILFCDSCDPLDSLLSSYHTNALSSSKHL